MIISQTNLEDIRNEYPEIPIGRSTNLSGKTYGRLTVLYRAKGEQKEGYWICRCECGNYCLVRARCLNNGSSRSCGCLSKEVRKTMPHQQPEDLTGRKFGRLTVLERAHEHHDNNTYWLCQCDCGNVKEIAAHHLKSGATKSCGCLNDELRKARNAENHVSLVGKKFGKLVVIEDAGYNPSWHASLSKCRCDCGRIVTVSNNNLKSGNTESCGCDSSSHGERRIRELLMKHNISFLNEYHPVDLQFEGRYDFAILGPDGEVVYFIEFDGKQHFDKNSLFYRDHKFDEIKNDYCYESGIPLIRIPYTVKNISIEDLLLDTSKYVMSEVKEKEYYAF